MKRYSICIMDSDAHYTTAFMAGVALGHAGYSVMAKSSCDEGCAQDVDACISFGAGVMRHCGAAFSPVCGRYAGVSAILSEARAFIFDRAVMQGNMGRSADRAGSRACCTGPLAEGTFICFYSCAGGLGTSCAAIGIGRELCRYRGERAAYLSLEDSEDRGLFPAGAAAMRLEEALYRYMRIGGETAAEAYGRLFSTAAAPDEYGLYRLAPDDGPNSLAGLGAAGLYVFLTQLAAALGLTKVVLDFGTRLGCLASLALLFETGEAHFVEVVSDSGEGARKRRPVLMETPIIEASFPFCPEDIREGDGHTDVCLANSFGLAVKELCDRIGGALA